jgi:hypothetical protein
MTFQIEELGALLQVVTPICFVIQGLGISPVGVGRARDYRELEVLDAL